MSTSTASRSFPLFGLLAVTLTGVFTTFKLLGIIAWPWVWVLAPLWIYISIFIGLFVGILVLMVGAGIAYWASRDD